MNKALFTSTPMVASSKLNKDEGVNNVAQYMYAPREQHLLIGKRILHYLAGTLNYGLGFMPDKLHLSAFSDGDRGGFADDRRLIYGHCVFVGESLVSWSAKKKVVSRLTMEAEYRSLVDATAKVAWVDALLIDLKVP
ncbi:uncharacterized mitochondrial protein AtMg00810-like [Hibiscus syriacus]|uniref:uncharacterized mitochondrial protein AtMg00810-like n=1 Tax=Hibiscus syriacus TaxID=106335 RepID=UPI0019250EC5|nr:uncharacterized mitochondrial protein AtMg00810-like [Hibiscus syriacus]